MTQVANLIAVADGVDLPVIVRIAQPSRTAITKYLDMGARGILLSNVADAMEAETLGNICLYAPQGDRGISTFRAHTGYNGSDTAAIMKEANACNVVICQIESLEAAQGVASILAVPSVDGVLIGPNDMTQHMNIFGQYDHPDFLRAIEHVAVCAKEAGKWSGIITTNMKLAQQARKMGMTCFSAGSELSALDKGAKQQLQALQLAIGKE